MAEYLTALEKLRADNKSDHDRLSREAQQAISQLSSDSQFLDHVREIIRFFKTAWWAGLLPKDNFRRPVASDDFELYLVVNCI